MNSSGTTPLTFETPLLSLGGEGLVEYSVNEREFVCGVRGRLVIPSPLELPLPLTATPFSISSKVSAMCGGAAVKLEPDFDIFGGVFTGEFGAALICLKEQFCRDLCSR